MTQALTRWTANLTPAKRAILGFLALTLAIFTVGFFVGFGIATIEKGHLPRSPWSYLALVTAAAALSALVIFINALRHSQPARTSYEKRYNRAIVAFGAIGGLIGLSWAMLQISNADEPKGFDLSWMFDPAAFQALPPGAAIAAVVVLILVLGGAFAWYHRIIDDHEERGVLWGSTIGYYFMLFAVPCWLLLAAGGLLPTMTGAIALALVLASTVVQAAVWAWLKYR